MKKISFLLFFSTLLLFSCSPSQRLQHLLRHHPELIKTDTVFHKDTLIIKESRRDTVFKNEISRDTVIIKEDRLTIKYFNRGDSIFIKGRADTIKIIREVPVTVNTIQPINDTAWYYRWSLYILLLAIAMTVIRIVQKKYF